VIHLKRYLSKLYPYLAGLLPKHSVPVLYQNKLKRQKRARHFTDGYTVRVYSNSFIEALHVLHETLATNNCFSAKACWYFLISKTYRPVEMASTTHMFRNALSDNERTEGRNSSTKRRLSRRIDSHRGPLIIDRLLLICPVFLNNFSNLYDSRDIVNISTAIFT